MVLERMVPGGTGFGANRPVTIRKYCPFLCLKFESSSLEYQLGVYVPLRALFLFFFAAENKYNAPTCFMWN